MRMMRCYCESIDSESVLDPNESNHLCRVLRAETGTAVELFDGKGILAHGKVLRSDKKKAVIGVHQIEQIPPASGPRLILAVSFAKGQRFDWLVEKCTELGVDHIAAVQFEHTVKLGKADAMERYHRIAITAAKQSRRLYLPLITGPDKPESTLKYLKTQYPKNIFLFGDPGGRGFLDTPLLQNNRDCILIIGPEGGLSNVEKNRLLEWSAVGIRINPNILRIETAAAAFCAAFAAARV